jgi:hypothetical protein
LSTSQVPTTASTTMTGTISYTVGSVTYRYVNITARANPGSGNGSVISASGECPTPGTRIGRFQIANTVPFAQASTAKHIFSAAAGSGRTNTVVSAYVNGLATNVTVASSNLAYDAQGACNNNLSINGCAVQASVSVTDVLCFGGSDGSVTVTLSGTGTSSTGTYSLDGGAAVEYSSNPFTVSGLSAGTHTISISSGTCSASTGEFTVNGPLAALTSSFEATACDSYTLPWGGVVTSSGAYEHTYTTAVGCDSVVTANVTINNSTSTSTDVSNCSSYALPWGTTVTTSGAYDYTYSTAAGCDSVVTYNVTINLPTSSTTNLAICSGSLPYSWNGQSLTGAGTYTATLTNAAGCDSVATLNLTISGGTPAQPAATAVTQTLVSNVCGARVYRYAVSSIANASGYAWSFTGLGTTGVVDSGDASSSRVIVVRYTSNAAAGTGDSVRVRAYSGCGTSLNRAARLINTVLTVPAAPAAITVTPVTTNVCGNRVYTYTASALVPAGATTTAATGWSWSFTGLGTTAEIVSGDLNSQSITVSYTSNAAAATGDSVRVAYTSACGNSLNRASKLTNTLLTAPAAPAAITVTPVTTNVCGNRVYTYTASALVPAGATITATTAAATGWSWSFTGLGTTAEIVSGDVNSQSITVRYTSNAAAAAGDSVRVAYTSSCGNSLNRASKLTNTLLTVPAAPAAITVTPITTNVCGNRVYRYTASALVPAGATTPAATGWSWSFTGLGTTGEIISGGVDSQSITVRYTSNAAAAAGDSVRVAYTSSCGNSLNRSLRLTNTLLSAPAAPASITATPISLANTCGNRVYRYTAPALAPATATAGAATGWLWSFTGTLGANATIDSGDVDSRVIVVRYTSSAASAVGDSVRVLYTSACGNGLNKSLRLTNTALVVPAAPLSITVTPINLANTCGNRVYRYAAPVLSATLTNGTATVAPVTGWSWSFVGTLGENAVIDSGDVNSRVIVVRYTSSAASAVGDSVRVAYTTSCGNSLRRALKLTNTKLVVPVPAAITVTPINNANTCGNRVYRYTAAVLTTAQTTGTATAPPVTGYSWSFVGTLGNNATIDSGDVNSRVIVVRYTNSSAAATGDSVRLAYTSSCGNGANRSLKLTNTALTLPAAPASIVATNVSVTTCGNRVYRYTAPVLTSAQLAGTATAAPITGYLWSFTGTLGANAVIDSGDVNSRIIVVRYTSNAAAVTGDSVRVRYTSSCGNGANRALRLTNLALTNCPPPANTPVTKVAPVVAPSDMNVKVYPNPTTNNFNVQVLSGNTGMSVVRVMDLQGRVLKTMQVSANETVNLGSDLRAGAYIVEVRQGKSVKTTRVLKF